MEVIILHTVEFSSVNLTLRSFFKEIVLRMRLKIWPKQVLERKKKWLEEAKEEV